MQAEAKCVTVQTALGTEEVAIRQYDNPAAAHDVIAWHGLSAVNAFWYWDVFWQHARVTLAGLPGHGAVTPPKVDRWSPQHFIDVGEATARRFYRGRPMTLIGHSTGGMVALGVAMQAPELVARVILLNAVIWHELTGIVGLWQSVSASPALSQAVLGLTFTPTQLSFRYFRESLRAFVSSPQTFYANPRFDDTMQAGYPDYCGTSREAIRGTCNVLNAADLRPQLQRTPPTQPVLVIHGARDGIVPLAQAKWVHDHLPNSELFVIPGAGHLAFGEFEPLVNRRVADWAAATQPSSTEVV